MICQMLVEPAYKVAYFFPDVIQSWESTQNSPRILSLLQISMQNPSHIDM